MVSGIESPHPFLELVPDRLDEPVLHLDHLDLRFSRPRDSRSSRIDRRIDCRALRTVFMLSSSWMLPLQPRQITTSRSRAWPSQIGLAKPQPGQSISTSNLSMSKSPTMLPPPSEGDRALVCFQDHAQLPMMGADSPSGWITLVRR